MIETVLLFLPHTIHVHTAEDTVAAEVQVEAGVREDTILVPVPIPVPCHVLVLILARIPAHQGNGTFNYDYYNL